MPDVVIVRPATRTLRNGDVVADWDDVTETSVAGVAFAPGRSSENNDGRTAVSTEATLYGPIGLDVTAGDRVVVGEATWEVVGDPARWSNPLAGIDAGTEVAVRRVVG